MQFLLYNKLCFSNINKTGTRQYTRAVWSTFAEIHSRYPPRFIDALFGLTGISG